MGANGPGNAPLLSVSAASVCGPTAPVAASPPVSPARTPSPAALKASAGSVAGAPAGVAGGDQGGAAPALEAQSARTAIAAAAARRTEERCMSGANVDGGGDAAPAGGSGREVELLGDLLAVAALERDDLPVAEVADHRDPRVRRPPAGVRDQADVADDRAVDFVRCLDIRLEAVPEVLNLVEPAADPAVAPVAGPLVEQAEDGLRLDVRIDLGEHAL